MLLPGTGFSPEVRALVGLGRARLPDSRRAEVETILTAGIDWNEFATLSLKHRLAAVVALHIQSGSIKVPSPVAEAFSNFSAANETRQALLVGELIMISRRFDTLGIGYAALKGPALAQRADGRQDLRTTSDLDILVRLEDIERARAALSARGMTLIKPFDHTRHDEILARPGSDIFIELHRRLSRRDFGFVLPFTAAPFGQPRATTSVAGHEVATLSDEENLLYTAHHGERHSWSRLTWLTGFAGLLESASATIDFDTVRRMSRENGLDGTLALALAISRDAFDVPVPSIFSKWITNRIQRLAGQILRDALKSDGTAREGVQILHYSAAALSLQGALDQVAG